MPSRLFSSRQLNTAITLLLAASCGQAGRPQVVVAEAPLPKRNSTEAATGKIIYARRDASNPDDATAALQRAIDSDAETVVIPYTGTPWIVRPLVLRSSLKLIMEPGVILEAKSGSFREATDSLLLCKNVHDVSIIAYGATIRMRKDDYKSGAYKKGEWRHGLCLQGATNVVIRGVRIERTGGDGIYIGPTWDARRNTCTNILIADCALHENYRQGISVVSGVDVRIENCLITGTSGTAPQAGVDIEPSHFADRLTAIHLLNCVAEGNAGSGFMANLARLSRKSKPISVRIERCLVRNSVQPGLRAMLHEDHGATGWIEFVDCTVEGTQYAGAKVVWDTDAQVQLRFDKCRWADVAKRSGQAPITLELSGGAGANADSSVEFKDSIVFERKRRNLVRLKSEKNTEFPGVRGIIYVDGPDQRGPEVDRLPNLQVKRRE